MPKFRAIAVFSSFMLVLSLVTGCGKSDDGKTLATFDGMKITRKEFDQKLSSLPRQLRAAAMRNKREFLEDMANEHYLLREAERRHLDSQPDVKDLLNAARKKILVAKLVDSDIDKKVTITPEEVRAYYDSHKDDFMTPLLLRAQHILVKTEDEAKAIRAQLDSGADFEELARAKSIDATAMRGGDLGFFQKGQFLPDFEDAVFALKKGQTGEAKTQYGYHIIRLTDRAEPRLRDFNSVKSYVEERILREKRSALFKDYVGKLRKDAKLKVDEKTLEEAGP
jgi:peptidyl-prolyl cis-trans isomerase C